MIDVDARVRDFCSEQEWSQKPTLYLRDCPCGHFLRISFSGFGTTEQVEEQEFPIPDYVRPG